MDENVTRRAFIQDAQWRVLKWAPWLGLLGFRFHAYSMGPAAGYVGWVTWFGRLVGFVPK